MKRCARAMIEGEDGEAPRKAPITASHETPTPAIDRHVTNQLLSITLTLQNQIVVWTQSLKQTAEYHSAALTPTQREAVAAIVSDCLMIENNLERHRALLSGVPRPPAGERLRQDESQTDG